MKKILVIALTFWCTASYGQNSLLFEVTGNGLEKPSYLFGTMHVQDEAAFSWNDSVLWAIGQVDAAAFELDLSGKELKKGWKPDKKVQKEWEDFIADDLAPAIESSISPDTLGARIAMIYGQALNSILKKDKTQRGTFIDKFLQEYAEKLGKEIVSVETVNEQLNIVLGMDKSKMKKAIVNFIKEDNWDIDLEVMMGSENQLVEAYATKSLTNVCQELQNQLESSSSDMASDFYKKLFDDRNAIMFKRTDKMLDKKSMFVAVGAGHLCGLTGLVEQYKKAGYTLRPMDIGAKTSNEITWTTYENEIFSVSVPTGVSKIYAADEDYDYMSAYDANPDASLYTTMGKAEFSVEIVYISEEIEEAEYYDGDTEDAYYNDEVEDHEGEATDGEYSSDDLVYEDAEGNYSADELVEDEVEEVYYEEEEVEEVDEVIYYEDEAEEAVEVAANYDGGSDAESDEAAYDEVEEEVEETEEIIIVTDDDEAFGELKEKKKKKKKKKSDDSMKLKDRMNEEYWTIVMKSVMSQAMGQMMKGAMAEKEEKEEEVKPDEPVVMVTVMGQEYKVKIEDKRFGGYSYTVEIPNDESSIYELVIEGDHKILDSHELNQFFSSFQLK